jgi:hypothetical protein
MKVRRRTYPQILWTTLWKDRAQLRKMLLSQCLVTIDKLASSHVNVTGTYRLPRKKRLTRVSRVDIPLRPPAVRVSTDACRLIVHRFIGLLAT